MKLKNLIPYAIVFVLAFFLFKECSKDKSQSTRYVQFVKTIEIPPISGNFEPVKDPVPLPKIIREIDSTWYRKYQELKSEKEKDSLFEKSISINEYNEKFEDTFQSVNVFSKTRGQLLEQSVNYETKPQAITVKDSVAVPGPKRKLYFTAEGGTNKQLYAPKGKFGLMYQNKKGMAYKASIDTDEYIWFGVGVPLFEF